MIIIAIDPGGTTGVAVWSQTEGLTVQAQIDDRYAVYEWLDNWNLPNIIIVVEDFKPRKGALSYQPDALRIIGYAEGLAHLRGWGFKLQTPADAKTFSTNDKLRKVGFYRPNMDHARDAARHLLLYLCSTSEGRASGGEALLKWLVS